MTYPLTPIDSLSATAGYYPDDGVAEAPESKKELDEVGPAISSSQGEYIRLKEDMIKLAQRNIWEGVEKNYQAILNLDGVKIEARVYFVASQAGQARGDILAFYQRTQLILSANPDSQTKIGAEQNKASIESSYGFVEIHLSAPADHVLNPSEPPFAPDERKSIEFANKELQEKGVFKGLLPIMTYQLTPSNKGEPTSFELISVAENPDDSYQLIRLEKGEAKAPITFEKPGFGKNRWTIGPTAGAAFLTSLSGPSYSMPGVTVGFYATWSKPWLFASIGSHSVGFLPAVRGEIRYQNVMGTSDNSIINTVVLQPSARPGLIVENQQYGLSAGGLLAGGAQFLFDDNQAHTGTGEVPFNPERYVQTPEWGVFVGFESHFREDGIQWSAEISYEQARIGLEGPMQNDPDFETGGAYKHQVLRGSVGLLVR